MTALDLVADVLRDSLGLSAVPLPSSMVDEMVGALAFEIVRALEHEGKLNPDHSDPEMETMVPEETSELETMALPFDGAIRL